MSSPFLSIPESAWVGANALAFAIRDRYPVSPGHTLIITRRVVPTWFEATADERTALFALVDEVKGQLDASDPRPDGYNVGFNAGDAAGQTVPDLHVHVIPRYRGDMPDPRGGVRHVIPWRGNYLRPPPPPLATGAIADPFLRHLTPLLARATSVAIVAAFVQESGLAVLRDAVFRALARGANVQILTGDYLDITQVGALEELLGWANVAEGGRFSARVVEVAKLPGTARSFHPKSWRLEGPGFGVAFVGSSNVSRGALGDGIEWNLRTERERDPGAFDRVVRAYDELWARATPLSAGWIAEYAKRARLAPVPPPPGEVELDVPEPPPEPNDVQREALAALAASRAEGRRRALVVLATGLGKTWLAAFDVEELSRGRERAPRVLFLAHRAELLAQAARTFRRLFRRSFPSARTTWFVADHGDLSGDLVLASVQKLSRRESLDALSGHAFDYVVVDEVHHASAKSYREVLARLDPGFLLGLTATPDRADEGDVLGLFDDHVPYRVDLGAGIERGLLVPFAYHGLKDDVNYANLPWKNRRFDPDELARAVQTQQRMERLWKGWSAHPAARTLVFCCSIPHARFASEWLKARGVASRAVHSEDDSDDRDESLRGLAAGTVQAVCAVDLFNEGLDLPAVDRVVMLRPTESPVVFLQQLGRGLRLSGGKDRLIVLDFVGNHRVFLERVRRLLSLVARPAPTALRDFLGTDGRPELPPGCSLGVELEAKELLLKLLMPSGRGEVERVYRELFAARGERPTAGELHRLGCRPSTLPVSWFEFVAGEGHLDEAELRTLAAARDWFEELERTTMVKSFKMVVLEALLEADALQRGLPLDELARRSHAIVARSPELFRDLEGVTELDDPRHPEPAKWLGYWLKNPIAAWAGAGKRWFRLEGDRFVPRLPGDDPETLAALTRELVDYRLAQYRARRPDEAPGSAFECKLISNKRDPILKLPSRAKRPDLPQDEVPVRLPNGRVWLFRFMKEFVNVAHPAGGGRNELPDLLRSWFGLAAGREGTAFAVRFVPSPNGWWVEPAGERVPVPTRGVLRAYPTLQAAAGAAAGALVEGPEAEEVRLPSRLHGEDVFAVRASGDSMDGGARPIRDGDWLILRHARAQGIGAVAGRVALVELESESGSRGYQLKRVVAEGRGWVLRSDNPARPSFPASERTVPIAVLVETLRPEDLAPPVGTRLTAAELAAKLGLTEAPSRTGRVDGHLFLVIEERGAFTAPDRIEPRVADRRPGETAFVLARSGGSWRYSGVARWLEGEDLWECPALDHATWRELGGGREVSRRLPEGAEARAAELAGQLPVSAWIEHRGKRCRVVGRAPRGGPRIDGGEGGFAERTVSLTDLAWVLVASDDVRRAGGVLDEARVNRSRYLEGTPRGSTRWIDTGWAIVLVEGEPVA